MESHREWQAQITGGLLCVHRLAKLARIHKAKCTKEAILGNERTSYVFKVFPKPDTIDFATFVGD